MRRRVVVTGLGAVTSISCQVEDLWKKILAGQRGVHELTVCDTQEFKVHFGGDIADWSTDGYLPAKEAKRVDRFAQFFIIPLFTDEYTAREVNAVNSEYQKNIMNDGWRQFRIASQFAKDGHPERKFNIGNLETL